VKLIDELYKSGQVLRVEYQVDPTIKTYDLEVNKELKELDDSLFHLE
jgi:hypothetical protein